MGIYSDGSIYGVCLIIRDKERYKKVSDRILSKEDLSEIKIEFNKLSEEDKGELIIHFYTSLSSTYNSGISGTFISWFPGSKESLEKLLNTV
jgi:carbamoylphosphate synthase large subunit